IPMIRMRCETDSLLFARTFFPHHCRLSFSPMHRDFFRNYNARFCEDILSRTGYNEAIAAPRGFAKSTIKSLILPIHAILYQRERYIVIISATLKQAKLRLKNIKNELLTNDLLKKYYEIEIPSGMRKAWTQQSVNINDVQVEAYSAGTEIRGISFKEFRPTRVILDDAEDSSLVESSEGRVKLLEWFNEVIENLGDRYTIIEVIGTLLHPESLLAVLLKRPDFQGKVYRAIMDFAEEGGLWEKWKALFTDLRDENRMETAKVFFMQNKNAMIKGSRVLWNAKEDYYSLMTQIVTRGSRAFYQEKQNDPRFAENRVFSRDQFRYFTLEGDNILVDRAGMMPHEVHLSELTMCGFLDSAMGGSGKGGRSRGGDFAAIVTVGRDSNGYIYVLDAWLKKTPPTKQIARIFELHNRFSYHQFGFEGNCFQSLLRLPLEEEKEKRKNAGGKWDVPIIEVTHKVKKEARIMSLEPLISNGWILFNRALSEEFFRQMEDIPNGMHDDGPDSLEAAVGLAKALGETMKKVKSSVSEERAVKKPLSFY
ncbi:phage terminase large subunit, partial [Candidatus Sumerlaeota bacterium]|nr:phage terminase large subunit [Candidatus Sumerlaeota bacterium]